MACPLAHALRSKLVGDAEMETVLGQNLGYFLAVFISKAVERSNYAFLCIKQQIRPLSC